MNKRAEITTTEIRETYYRFTCQMHINDKWQGDLYTNTKEELISISKHVCAIPEMTKAIEAYMSLHKVQSLSVEDFTIKSEELERLMKEANEKIHGV